MANISTIVNNIVSDSGVDITAKQNALSGTGIVKSSAGVISYINGIPSNIVLGDGSLYNFPLNITSPSSGQVLKYNGTSWVNDSDAGITGSGTTNYLPKFTGASTLGNSLVYDDGTNAIIGGTSVLASDTSARKLVLFGSQSGIGAEFILQNDVANDAASNAISFVGIRGSYGVSGQIRVTRRGVMTFHTQDLQSLVSPPQRMLLDANGNFGIGATPSAWGTSYRTALQVNNASLAGSSGSASYMSLMANAFLNSSAQYVYISSNFASRYEQVVGGHAWYTAASGTAGNTISFTEAARLTQSGNFIINNASTDNGLRFQVTGDGYFSGSVGIGSSALTGFALRVSKNIEGGTTSYGSAVVSTVQSGVTTGARIFYSEVGTQATAFTLFELNHYYAVQGTIGAGSNIVNQYGFRVHPTLVGASNNYGFYGDIASGTGRWNLYMNGSANNHINGSLAIGTTTFNDNVNPYKAVVFYTTSGSGGGGLMVTSNQAANGANAMVSAVQWGLSDGSVSKPSGLFFNYSNTTHGNRANNTVGNLISRTLVAAANLSITNNNGYISHVDLNSTSNDYVNYQAYLYVQRNSGTVNVNSYTSFRSMYQTAVANETITDIIDFRAAQPTLSTGALVTNRYGLLIDFNNTQVTNAWGVYQSQSTVNNYMNGALLIGTTTVGTYKLDVNGTMRVSGASTFGSSIIASGLISSATEFRLANLSYSRVAIWDGSGGFAGGYNFKLTAGVPQYDSTGAIAGYYYNASGEFNIYTGGGQSAGTNATRQLLISNTGAATFSSSVTANTSINGYQGGVHNLLIDFSASSQVTTLTNTELFFGTNAQRRMTISSGGNVLVGDTNNPGNRIIAYQNTTHSSENSYSIAAANASSTGKKMMLGYDGTLDVGLIAAADTGVSWKNISIPWGNVGIGTTTNAGYKLDVNGTMRVSGASTLSGAVSSNVVFRTNHTGTGNEMTYIGERGGGVNGGYIQLRNANVVTVGIDSNGASFFNGGNVAFDTNTLFVDATNNRVGIGTASPSVPLDVVGAATFSSSVTAASVVSTGNATINGVSVGRGSGASSTNTAVGLQASNSTTTGTYNSSFGHQALFSNTTGTYNVAIGTSSLYGNTTGQFNTAIGLQAGYGTASGTQNITGSNNIFIGKESVGEISSESNRTWIGNTSTVSTWVGGNLLIGTRTNSTYILDAAGNTRLTGTLLLTGIATLSNLAGAGTRIVVADASGNLSTQPTSTYLSSLSGEATNSGSVVTLTNSAVIGKVLTGLNVSSATITASDSILTAFGKIQGQIDALQGGTVYNGSWNANTNTPTITSSTGTQGEYYVVTTAGTTTIDGVSSWAVGDWIIFNGTVWEKIPNVDAITSVNGQTGVVSLTTSNINEGTNLYYTDARARAAISLTTSGSSGASTYSSGVLNIPTYTLAGLGGTPSTRTLTINGTSLDLSVDRSFSVGSVTSVSGTGTVSGLTLTGSITNSGSITLGGALTLTSENVTTGLGFTPYNSTNPAGYTTNTGTVTSIVAGTYLTGGTITTSGTIAVDATTTNTASKIVARDASGNFSAGTITTLGVVSNNFYDSTGSYNVNIGSGGIEGRGVVAGYSGTAYSGIGYNVRHGSAVTYIAPLEDTSSYLSFSNGGFVFYGAPSGAIGRTLSYTTLGSFSAAGTFNAVNITVNGNQTLHAANWNSYAPSLTGTGASGNWGINITGNAVNLSTTRNNWVTNGTITAVVGQLGWRNFGNGHTIFDASNQLSPDGTAVNNTNPSVPWTANYPTLMGWNGSDTYGVRVDISKNAENLGGISSNRAMLKRRNAIVPGAGDSLNTSITSAEMGFTYGGSGEPAGPFISFGGLNLDINYSCQLVGGYVGGNDFKIRTRNDDTPAWNPWRTIITDGNYNSYSPTLTGTGASGTWGINITGNAATATTWQNARTFTIGSTGKSVDGSGNVSWTLGEIGAIPGGSSGQIQFNSSGVFTGSSNFLWDSTENGMRISYASSQGSTYKLQVNGAVYASSYYESSDIKQKNVLAVNPRVSLDVDVVKFTRIGDDDVRYGYSAQQIRDVAPELVSSSGSLGVKYIDVHTLKIAALENEIKELKNKLNGLG